MDFDILAKCIIDLIDGHSKVDVPGVGVFCIENVPAAYIESRSEIRPPHKTLSFAKSNVAASDGFLLIDEAAKKLGVGKDDASRLVLECTAAVKEKMKNEKQCVLPGLGTLKSKNQFSYIFIPEPSPLIDPDSLGLEPVEMTASSRK